MVTVAAIKAAISAPDAINLWRITATISRVWIVSMGAEAELRTCGIGHAGAINPDRFLEL